MPDTQVLIAGAGPTGLVLALSLARAGILPRVIDKKSGPGEASRAMAVQARTLEFYRQLGFADEVVDKGIRIETLQLRLHGRPVEEFAFGDIGEGLSPYPFAFSFPQDDHERLLVDHLKAAGINIEWETELAGVEDTVDEVRATLRRKDGTQETCTAAYLCGCDGAHSAVREAMGIGFPGGTYDKVYFVADVAVEGDAASDHALCLCIGAKEFVLLLPVRSTGMHRLIGVLPEELQEKDDVVFEDIRSYAESTADIEVTQVNWFSRYHVHHRVAEKFRSGRAFLLGDAGHIHSPVGGQGMNTGIGDAVNLAWKLAAVLQERAAPSLLDTYDPERIAFAHALIATTDQAFQLMNGSGAANELFRETLLPLLAPFALGFSGLRRAAFRLISQTRIHYRESALSHGVAGHIHGGDRLPWVSLDENGDNFAPLQSVDWQIHVYGEATAELIAAAQDAKIALHAFGWVDAMEDAGLRRDALYVVRPDGYVALAGPDQDAGKLKEFLQRFQIVSRSGSA